METSQKVKSIWILASILTLAIDLFAENKAGDGLVFKGISYVSWTRGEYPVSTSWKPQTYFDSQAIPSANVTTNKAHSGRGALELIVDSLNWFDPHRKSGETFVDMRYHPPQCDLPNCVAIPVNLCGVTISAWVYCDSGSSGNPTRPNGLQIFVKDKEWKSFYGTWHNIELVQEGKWRQVTITPSMTAPPGGYMEPGFDCSNIIAIGLKIGAGGGSTTTFSGKCWLDDIAWGNDACSSKYAFENVDHSLKALRQTSANYVSLITTWYMDKPTTSMIYRDSIKTHTDDEIIETINKIREQKMEVMLKPHVDVQGDSVWRGYIKPPTPLLAEWFQNYTKFMTHYARMAQRYNVGLFCIGTELASLDSHRTYQPFWYTVIDSIKKYYHGPLTYAVNWDGYQSVRFWDRLDFAGIDAYFPLSDLQDPPLSALVEGWASYTSSTTYHWVEEIAAWRSRIGKDIIFTEIGYGSRDYSAREPWLVCSVTEASSNIASKTFNKSRRSRFVQTSSDNCAYNPELQARCYEAALQVWSKYPWFKGMFWWTWLTYSDAGGPCSNDFTPQNKPAEAVLRKWYDQPVVVSDQNTERPPDTFSLSPNYPNPFNHATVMHYQIPVHSQVTVQIYDMVGRLVRILADQKQPSGFYNVRWDGKDGINREVANGVYFFAVRAGNLMKTQKIILLR